MPAIHHTDPAWRAYVVLFCGTSALLLGALGALNYTVDPYLTHQWDTPQVQRLRPTREKLGAWGKTYALARYQPQVVYIGNSRTELGVPTAVSEFGAQQVFNGALSGSSLGDAIAMLDHARTVSRLGTVVWGIDPPSFSMEIGNTDFDRELVAHDRFYLWRRVLINLRRALSIDMTRDSIRLLRGNFGAACHSSLAYFGQRDEVCINDRINGWGGTRAAILPRTREFVRGSGPTPQAWQALETSVDRLCRAGTRLRLYVNPTHAMMLDALYQVGKGPAVEAWQGQLAELAQRRRADGCDVRVYDFSGFNSITTEAIPQVTQLRQMRHYWETSHYRVHVGRMILARMFDTPPAPDAAIPDDFGVELTPAGVAAHIAAQRAGRERYHAAHPEESAMAQTVARDYLQGAGR